MKNFSAIVAINNELANSIETTIDFSIDTDDASNLTYDEVELTALHEIDKIFGFTVDDYEKADDSGYDLVSIELITIHEDDGTFPVISEDKDPKQIADENGVDKVLILPWATYKLTDEAKLWMKMKELGIIPEDSEFDFNKYHKLCENGIVFGK